jgi:hypothetical protein
MIAFVTVPFIATDTYRFDMLHVAECATMVVMFVVACVAFYDAPPTPASFASATIEGDVELTDLGTVDQLDDDKRQSKRRRRCESLITILRDPACIALWVGLTLEYGVYNVLCVAMEQQQHGRFTQQQNGITAGLMVLGGVVGTVVSTTIVDRLKTYKAVMMVLCATSIAAASGYVALELTDYGGSGGFAVIIIVSFVMGACTLADTVVGIETAAELTYPMHEIMTSSIFTATGCPIVFGMIIFATSMNAISTFYMILAACIVSVISTAFVSSNYLRTEADSRRRRR